MIEDRKTGTRIMTVFNVKCAVTGKEFESVAVGSLKQLQDGVVGGVDSIIGFVSREGWRMYADVSKEVVERFTDAKLGHCTKKAGFIRDEIKRRLAKAASAVPSSTDTSS